MKLFAYFKPADADERFLSALMSLDPDELRKFSTPIEKAYNEIKDWAISIGGSMVSNYEGALAVEIPVERVQELSEFIVKYEQTTQMQFGVGIGMLPIEAFKALKVSQAYGSDKIVMYSEQIEQEFVNAFDSGIEKAMPEGGEQQSGLQFPGLELENTDQPQQEGGQDIQSQSAQPEAKEKATPKQKVVETLMQVKQNAPGIAKLKEVDPKAYAALKKLIDAFVEVAQKGAQ